MPTKRRTAHPGRTFWSADSSALGGGGALTRASSAVMLRSAALPKAARRVRSTALASPGPRSPLTESSSAGKPRAAISPCSPTLRGNARRENCAINPDSPGRSPVSSCTAASTVLRSEIGDQGPSGE